MRVLISGCLPPPMGGMATFYETLMISSLTQRIDLSFVQTSSQKRRFETSGRFSVSNVISAILDCWRFLLAVLKSRPQIVHIGTAFGLSFVKNSVCIVISRFAGCRVLLHPHCSFTTLYLKRPSWWQLYFRWVIRQVHGVIVISKEWHELLTVVPECKVFELPNAINLKFFHCVAEKHFAVKEKKAPVQVLYLGYLGKAKGSFDLLDAANMAKAAVDDLHFVLVGSELMPGELKHLQEKLRTDDLQLYVDILPPVFGVEKLDMFTSADIFIYPSYHEGMPMAVIEAMACGLPVVATRVGGLPDLIRDQVTGLLVDPARPDQLIDALRVLMRNDPLRDQIKRNSVEVVEREFDIEKRVDQLLEIYQHTLSVKKPMYRHANTH
jgi:glycosyltransferase involved in cell wall biosynthesis